MFYDSPSGGDWNPILSEEECISSDLETFKDVNQMIGQLTRHKESAITGKTVNFDRS